jgi:multidrug efflux pump subunit AcrA (membrane-fusion protein)
MIEKFPQIREELVKSQQLFENKTYYVIKDPITQRFFRVGEPEYFIIKNLDGRTSREEIIKKLQEKLNVKVSLETLDKFIEKLEKAGFLEGEISQRELSKLQYHARKKKKNIFRRIFFLKVKAFDPNRFLDRLTKRVSFLFTPGFFVFSILIIILGLLITIFNWGDLGYSLRGLYHITTIFKLWIAVFLIGIIHELGHAVTCKHLGGDVHEMGFLLIYFQPAFFTNVSDAWLFKDKSKKLWVSFAGIYIHIFLWASATILWRITDIETQLNSFLFVIMLASGIILLFNFNPLMKFDAYYLLSDYLEIPNLRKKAFGYLNSAFKRNILKLITPEVKVTPREKRIYTLYGSLSLVYSVLLLGYIFIKVENFLVHQFQGYGFVLFLVLIYFIFKHPAQIFLAGFVNFFLVKKEDLMRPKKIIRWSIIICAILLFLFLFRIQLRVASNCEIASLESYTLITHPDGYVQENIFLGKSQEKKETNFLKLISSDYAVVNLESRVKEGDRVKPGQIIASFSSTQYQTQLKEINAQIEKAEAHYQLLKNWPDPEEIKKAKNKVTQAELMLKSKKSEMERAKKLSQQNLISEEELERITTEHSVLKKEKDIAQNELKILKDGTKPEQLKMAQAEVERLQAEAELLEEQIQASEIKSPIFGIVTRVKSDSNFLSIENIDTVRVLIYVSEKDMDVIQPGLKVKTKVRSYPFTSFSGEVTRISHQSENRDSKKTFLVTSKVSNEERLLRSGMSGHAKIYCGKRSLIYVLTRKIIHYLRVEIWSWW